MRRIEQLGRKSKKYTIGDIEIEIKPLDADDLVLVSGEKGESLKEQLERTKLLVEKVLKESVPDVTDEEIRNLSLENFNGIVKCIGDVNGLKTTDHNIPQRILDLEKI